MKVQDIDLNKMLKLSPETGRLLLGEDRMLLFRQEAFGALRKLLLEQLGERLARALLSQFGHRCGTGDHRALTSNYQWDTDHDEMGAGPAMHAWEGLVHVEPVFVNFDKKSGFFEFKGIWTNSYEADLHISQFGLSSEPVCHTLTGYASGWCSAFMGVNDLVTIETECVGKGDKQCVFLVKSADKWGPEANPWKESLAATDTSLSLELEEKVKELERHRRAMLDLGTPIIQVWQDVVVLPVIGVVDTKRSAAMTESLLSRVATQEVKCVIMDLTGVDMVDTKTADNFIKTVRALELVGSRCIITGIRPEVAQTLTQLGVDMAGIVTLRSLKEGLEESLKLLGYRVRKISDGTGRHTA
ncbi:MAG: XylR N-terminal domain-containing protein [Myxococcaceae bacterium]